jgi:hypothetical protein
MYYVLPGDGDGDDLGVHVTPLGCDHVVSSRPWKFSRLKAKVAYRQLDAQRPAKTCQHGLDILKLDPSSSSKTSPASDIFVHSQALPLHLNFIGIYPFLDFWSIEPTRFG